MLVLRPPFRPACLCAALCLLKHIGDEHVRLKVKRENVVLIAARSSIHATYTTAVGTARRRVIVVAAWPIHYIYSNSGAAHSLEAFVQSAHL